MNSSNSAAPFTAIVGLLANCTSAALASPPTSVVGESSAVVDDLASASCPPAAQPFPAADADVAAAVTPMTEDVMSQPWLVGLFVLFYGVVFMLGVFGNSLVVYVVVRNRAMQTVTNVFITNLAVSDVIMCLLAVPFTPISGLLRSWIFGEALCHIVPMTLGVSVHVSTLTSTAIAVDRYFVIVHPFAPRITRVLCLVTVAVIWAISLTVSMPLGIYQRVFWLASEGVYACREHWPNPTARQFFTVASLILQYLVPGSVITFCYAKVSPDCITFCYAKVRLGFSDFCYSKVLLLDDENTVLNVRILDRK